MLAFPNTAEIREWLMPYAAFGALWLVVMAYQTYLAWHYRDARGRRIAGIVVGLAVVAVGVLLFGRAAWAAHAFPFDPDAVESITVERVVEVEHSLNISIAGGPEVAQGLTLLNRSGSRLSSRALRGRIHYRVTIKLKGEDAPSRYVDAYPDTQHGVPGVEPGFLGTHIGLGAYRSDEFVRWIEDVSQRHAGR